MQIPFSLQSYQSRSLTFDAQRIVNVFPIKSETGESEDETVAMLLGTPGLSLFATLPDGPVRGLFTGSDGTLYCVAGRSFLTVGHDGTSTLAGTLQSFIGSVSFADIGSQVCVVDGNNGYIYTLADRSFTQITDEGWRGSVTVAAQNSRFLFHEPGTNTWYISSLGNGLMFDASEFSTADGSPSPIQAIFSDHLEVWIVKQDAVEVWYPTDNADFPYSRLQGVFVQTGSAASFTFTQDVEARYWATQDKWGHASIVEVVGYQPQRISNYAVEFALSQIQDWSTARMWTYQEEGHRFVALSSPELSSTWYYDASMRLWHERASLLDTGLLTRHTSFLHAFAYGQHVTADIISSTLYTTSLSHYDDNGASIPRWATTPYTTKNLKWVLWNRLQLNLEAGVGLDGGTSPNLPIVMLDWSEDGGRSWSNERQGQVGAIGDYIRRVYWTRLGRGRTRILRVRMTDPVKCAWLGFEADLAPCGV